MMAKIQGNIVDVLMPPLSAGELALGYVLGGVTRGLAVAVAVGASLAVFVPMRIHDLGLIVFYAASASFMLATLGIVIGLWADKYDHVASITNFIITPLSFLSGHVLFGRAPARAVLLCWRHLNPFFYMIDGLRAGFIGRPIPRCSWAPPI